MSVLIIGGDRIEPMKEVLREFGASRFTHWDARNPRVTRKKIPECTQCVVMMTDFLNHNAMNHFKREAKRLGIALFQAERGVPEKPVRTVLLPGGLLRRVRRKLL